LNLDIGICLGFRALSLELPCRVSLRAKRGNLGKSKTQKSKCKMTEQSLNMKVFLDFNLSF
jgi:hypothetical protein